jgi:hypothetical protein
MIALVMTVRVILKNEAKKELGNTDIKVKFFSCSDGREYELMLSALPFTPATIAENPEFEKSKPSKLISRELGPTTEEGPKTHVTLLQPLCLPLHTTVPRLQYTSQISHRSGVKEIS